MLSEELVRPALLALLGGLVVGACYFDLARGGIPDWLTLPALAAGLAGGALAAGAAGFSGRLAGAALGGLLLGVPWLLKGVAGGDVKAAAAVGALAGPWFAARALVAAALCSAALAALFLVWRGWRARGERVPFGLALAAGALWALASWSPADLAGGP